MGHEAWSDDAPPEPYQPGNAPLVDGGPLGAGADYQAYVEVASQAVKPPAICLIVFGALCALLSLCTSLQGVAMLSGLIPQQEIDLNPQGDPELDKALEDMPEVVEFVKTWTKVAPVINVVTGFMGLVTGVLALVAGIRLVNLRGGTLAKVAAVLIMLPVSCCCCLGIPLGIWLFVVLSKPEVAAVLDRV